MSNTRWGTNPSSSSSQILRSAGVSSTGGGIGFSLGTPHARASRRAGVEGRGSCLQADRLVLRLQGLHVAVEGVFIAPAAHPLEDHGEGAPVPRGGAVRLGAVDRLAVVADDVAGLQINRDLARLVVRAVIGDALREPEDVRAAVRADALPMRAGDIPQAPVFFIDG